MPVPWSEHVRPLGEPRRHGGDFLQALVTDFSVATSPSGATLELTLSPEDRAIFSLEGKRQLREHARDRVAGLDDLRRRVDRCLADFSERRHRFHEPELPFRWASGGILPIARVGGGDSYVLFWRDIHPVGWNIANGGSESIEEMLDPGLVIAREFVEELVVASPASRSFRVVGGVEVDPEHGRPAGGTLAAALDRWRVRLEASDWTVRGDPATVSWRPGPDRVRVTSGSRHRETAGYFLNINGEDLGIEVDRVARFTIERDEVLLDGELRGDRLLNRLVGLFDREETDRLVREGRSRVFHPHVLFFSGRRHGGAELLERLNGEFLPQVRAMRTTDVNRVGETHLDLCPVTRRVIGRVVACRERGLA